MIQPNSLRSLEGLRGFLATFVLLHHVRWLLWEQQGPWSQGQHPWWANLLALASAPLRYGHEAVVCFFVLSGFFIHFRWARDASRGSERHMNVADYARRRAHRLLPPYCVALLATVLLDSIGRAAFPALYLGATGDAFLDQSFAQMQFSWQSILSALVLLPSSTGIHFGTDAPLWSLAYEFVYYALYPAWLLMRRRVGLFAYVAGPLAAILVAQLAPIPFARGVLVMYPLWLAGAALAEFVFAKSAIPSVAPVLMVSIGFAGMQWTAGDLLVIPYLFLGVGVVLATITLFHRFADSRIHKAFEWLGLRSYTIYVSHFPFVALISAATFQLAGARPGAGWLAIAGAIAALAWANLLWWACERRFLHAPLRA